MIFEAISEVVLQMLHLMKKFIHNNSKCVDFLYIYVQDGFQDDSLRIKRDTEEASPNCQVCQTKFETSIMLKILLHDLHYLF